MFGRNRGNARGLGRGNGFGNRRRLAADVEDLRHDDGRLHRHAGDPESFGGRGCGRGRGLGWGAADRPAWHAAGMGPGGGRGRGGHGGGGGGGGSTGGGRGRNRGGAFGAGGFCMCAACGHKVPHEAGVKCTGLKCPECGHTMVREELLNQHKQTGEKS